MTQRSSIVMVFVTAPDARTAEVIGRRLVEERLAACVNIVPGLRSLYRWRGELEESQEVLLIAKARRGAVETLAGRVRELHPYEVPEVVATEVVGGLQAYLDWVTMETERE
jgi:periplasmic divalent cation tolerance protein